MDEILNELRELKKRVSLLESLFETSQKVMCYETILTDIIIETILNCKDELYIQMCDYILKHNVIQLMENSKIYISHKGSWKKGNQELKDLFIFIEKKWIDNYLKFIDECDDLTGEQFEKYNDVIYSLNLNKNLTKIKQYIIDKIND